MIPWSTNAVTFTTKIINYLHCLCYIPLLTLHDVDLLFNENLIYLGEVFEPRGTACRGVGLGHPHHRGGVSSWNA